MLIFPNSTVSIELAASLHADHLDMRLELFCAKVIWILIQDRPNNRVLYPEELETLKQSYIDHHSRGQTAIFMQHVKNCSNMRTTELVIDAIQGSIKCPTLFRGIFRLFLSAARRASDIGMTIPHSHTLNCKFTHTLTRTLTHTLTHTPTCTLTCTQNNIKIILKYY
jgi:hypothetical protein